MVVLTLATLGVNTLPIRLATYREKGVLRRLSTTPARPAALLVAQLVINLVVAVVAAGPAGGRRQPRVRDPAATRTVPGSSLAFALGMSSLFAMGLLIAAVAPTTGAATRDRDPVFVAVMFLGGVYLPRWLLPEFLVQHRRLHAARACRASRTRGSARRRSSLPLAVHGRRSRSSAGVARRPTVPLGVSRPDMDERSRDGRRRAVASAKPGWERWDDALIGLVRLRAPGDLDRPSAMLRGPPTGRNAADHPRASSALAAAWIYVLLPRVPEPAPERPPARMLVFFVGLLVFASVLMLRAADVLHLHDHRLLLRLDAAAAGRSPSSGVFATSILINTSHHRLPVADPRRG